MKKQLKLVLSLALLSAATGIQAAEFEETARVLNVTPQVEQYNQPREECHTEYVPAPPPQRQSRGVGGSILGGVAGGLLGNQVGGGNGRTAATAVGAIAGALVGDRLENTDNNNGGYAPDQPVRQCRTVDHWQSRTNGYAVTYEYHGRSYTSVVPYDPGERIRLRVSVTPR